MDVAHRRLISTVSSPPRIQVNSRLSRQWDVIRKSRFTESQIVAILKEGEAGVALSELTRKHGISRATYFNWRAKYGGVSVSELKRMKELEAENAKLKRLYAELALENAAIRDLLSKKLRSRSRVDRRPRCS
jgi:putative transposase